MEEFHLDLTGYYTIRTIYGDIDDTTQYVHFKMKSGFATNFYQNDFEFHHGKNSRYGFVKDLTGNPIPGVSVSDGNQTVFTNSDGFYLCRILTLA